MKSKSLLMAMLLMVTTSMAFVSCSKEDVEEVSPTKYTVKYDTSTGYGTDLYIEECRENGDCIFDRKIEDVVQGKMYTFTADENAEKIRIYIDGYSDRWVQRVYYLEEGETISIIINGNTIMGTEKP